MAACVGAPVAVLWYLGQLTVAFTLPLALGLGSAVAACAYVFSVLDKPPEWSLGLPFPVGAAAVAAAGFVISAMWIDTIAGAPRVAVRTVRRLVISTSHSVPFSMHESSPPRVLPEQVTARVAMSRTWGLHD